MTFKEQVAGLTDARLHALAFRAWRAAKSKNDRIRKKAVRLRPLLREEIAARQLQNKPPN